jgi:tripartite-type tricarboxylate transporter receptor subunit TctC
MIGGQIQVMFDPVPSSIGHIRAGRRRALAVTTAMRSQPLPDVPSLGDFVTGYEAAGWTGIGAPKNTPAEKLNKEGNAGLVAPNMKAQLADVGYCDTIAP